MESGMVRQILENRHNIIHNDR